MNKQFLFLYFLIMLLMGGLSFKKIKDDKDFFVAGKKAGIIQVTGSLLASVVGSSVILGSVDFGYSSGWAGMWLVICASLGFCGLLPLVKYIKDFKGYNLPSMLGSFYGEKVQQAASLLIPIAWLGVIASQIMGAAKIISIMTTLTYTEGVILSGVIFIIYTLLGGQLSIIKTDVVQLGFIIFGVLSTFLFINQEPITINVAPMFNEKFQIIDLIVMMLSYSTTFVVGPDIYSRLFCAKDEKTMKNSIILTILVLLPLSYILAKIGIYGQQIFGGNGVGDSVLLVIAQEKLTKFLALALYFGILSAVISTADTTLLTASSLFAQVFIKDLKKENSIFVTRILIVVFGFLSILVAIKMKYILATLLLALSIYSGAFIVPTFLGIFGFRAKEEIVITSIVVGGVVALIGKMVGGSVGNYISISSYFINGIILYLGKKNKKEIFSKV
ncbi:sodium:solute symporter family protein [Fusobacterium sp. FSA-380-WT-3A]|uniref:sodium:solute symporter family protein n=1 Tax=Fusobacterium sp. FSA-380-WT-3A TaxID=2725304 RepID=UPI001477125A|nr:sodium:solute symporter family protein [Fusobacterium sp. FSA-380-WT-3A]NME35298.1 sodium:solute symporter family protein [Fusobacterium sp. FSA-380-WT-3A]